MTTNEEVAPCRTCGSPARERRVQLEMSSTDTVPPVEVKRVCTNRDCPTNNRREKSLTDVV